MEIIEPQSHERIYANLQTGECLWEPPQGVTIRQSHNNQWWELFDARTSRFYYYNVSSQQTVWHRPPNADIIPLAKLQTLQQRMEAAVKDVDMTARRQSRDDTTQTSQSIQQFKDDFTKSLYIHSTTTSPKVSRKHGHCHHHTHVSDGEMPLVSSGAIGHRFTPPTSSRSSQSSQSNVGVYGYMYRAPVFSAPQRSLESPRACDVLLDFDRLKTCDAKATEAQKGLDLMSRSYHSHYQSACLFQPDLSPSDAEKLLDASRRCGSSSYGNMSEVVAGQATPKQKPRAFPRTNPTFVGAQRFDGYTTYQRVNKRTSSSMSSGSSPRFCETSAAVHDPLQCYRTSIQMPSLQYYPGYPTLRQKRVMNHSFDVTDQCHHPYEPESGLSQPVGRLASAQLSDSQGEGTLVAPSRVKSRVAAGIYNEEAQSRRNSEPYYVNLPVRDAAVSVNCNNETTDNNTDTLRVNNKNFQSSAEQQNSKASEACDNEETADSLGGGVVGGAEDGFSDRSSVFSSTPPLKPFAVQGSAWIHPDFLARPSDFQQKNSIADWLQQDPEEGTQTTFDEQFIHGQKLLRQLQPLKFYSESDSVGHHSLTQGEASPVSRDHDTELHSLTEFDIEEFATKHLNDHRKGFLGKLLPIESVLTWSKDGIRKPLIRTPNKTVKKDSPEIFKKIQVYMGDRNLRGTTANQVLLDIVMKGWSLVELRDEIFIQLCRQTTKNPSEVSLWRGMEMLCVCLSFFPPSYIFLPYLQMHLNSPLESYTSQSSANQTVSVSSTTNQILSCRKHCQRRLEKVLQTGAKKGLCKPTIEEVEHAKKSIYAMSMFGSTLSEIMVMQSSQFPKHKLPWIQTVLSELVLRLNGARTEGIFRIPGDIDEVNTMKVQIDSWNAPTNCQDPSVPASLLKLWYRELYEPLIPYEYYSECIENYTDPDGAIRIVNRLPTVSRNVLLYLVRFLQVFAAPENVTATKMDINNLSMVMAPNFLRCRLTDPKIVFENARKEMGFVRTLIQHLETSEMEGII